MSEHKIGDQWIEKGSDSKMHMYKAVKVVTRGLCRDIIVKDLGILNDDGCLPAPWDSTKYPKITVLIGNVYNIEVMEGFWFMQVRGDTLEKAIERWNRRA